VWEYYTLPLPSSNHYACFPESCGRIGGDPQHRVHRGAGKLQEYNLHVVLSGRGYVWVDGVKQELTGGAGFLYAPGAEQNYGADPDDPWDVRWVHFIGGGVEKLLDAQERREVWLFALNQQRAHVESALDRLTHLSAAYEKVSEPLISAALYKAIVALMHDAQPHRGQAQSSVRTKMFEVADYIRNHCHEHLTLKEIAGQSGYSPYHLTRIFRETVGKPPMQYLSECRILLAKSLLLSTGYSVERIAHESGFGSSSYFIGTFRKVVGMTPVQFRHMYG
jgi:AraC-like DNA-binding protein